MKTAAFAAWARAAGWTVTQEGDREVKAEREGQRIAWKCENGVWRVALHKRARAR